MESTDKKRKSIIPPMTAEKIVDDIRRHFGLGDAYHLDIRENEDGTWTVADGLGKMVTVPAMGETKWRSWFQANYGDVIVDRMETSEA